ncbi:class I adenylate-forming enzyme family protein [Amycolatopsis sp. cg5]|uniref:class I adenylate-forming enzyme family protein n=1 Tax=Amycolatopsis sp. cg5 TaxID=3238802 RepID=UPI003523D6FC
MSGYPEPGEISLVEAIWGPNLALAVDDDRVAVIADISDGGQVWTRGTLAREILRLAHHFRSRGLGTGEVIALIAENSPYYIAAFHAVLAVGAAVLPLDPRSVPEDWLTSLRNTDAAAAVLDHAAWKRLANTGQDSYDVIVLTDDQLPSHPRALRVGELVLPAVPPPFAPGDGSRTAVLCRSSGTLGKPKTVAITHHNLTANLAQIEAAHSLDSEDVVLGITPLGHIYGMQMVMNHALRRASPIVLGPTRYSPDRTAESIVDHRVTIAYLVPSAIAELTTIPPPRHHLRAVASGGAPLGEATAAAFEASWRTRVVQGYGMTEAGCISFMSDGVDCPPGTVGVPLPGTEIRLIDPVTGAEVAEGTPGELWIRGPQVIPEVTGWLRTGDLVTRTDGGALRIVGRLKNIIKYKGHQVAPAALEEILRSHPRVKDAVVLGEPDPAAGEVPKAYVVAEGPVPDDELMAYVAERVAPHQRIRLVERLDRMPRNAAGKVDIRALRGLG